MLLGEAHSHQRALAVDCFLCTLTQYESTVRVSVEAMVGLVRQHSYPVVASVEDMANNRADYTLSLGMLSNHVYRWQATKYAACRLPHQWRRQHLSTQSHCTSGEQSSHAEDDPGTVHSERQRCGFGSAAPSLAGSCGSTRKRLTHRTKGDRAH